MTTSLPHGFGCRCCAGLFEAQLDRRRIVKGAAAVGLAALTPVFTSSARAASGHYEAMLLACIDPRFPQPTIAYMKSRGMLGEYSQFTIAGAAIGVVAPAFKSWHKTFWDNLAASIQLHHIHKVIALDHRDCGAAKIAYGAATVADRTLETKTHRAALAEFRKEVHKRHPRLAVETGLMALDGKVEMFT